MMLKFVFKNFERGSILDIQGKGIPDQRSQVHGRVSEESKTMGWKAELLSIPCKILMKKK